MRKFILFVIVIFLAAGSSDAQIFQKNSIRKAEKGLFGKSSRSRKEVKINEPRSVTKAKKKQEAKDRKMKKEYDKKIKQSQKRTYDIQTPDVQERMKQDKKSVIARDKAKKKNVRSATKKAGRKYR